MTSVVFAPAKKRKTNKKKADDRDRQDFLEEESQNIISDDEEDMTVSNAVEEGSGNKKKRKATAPVAEAPASGHENGVEFDFSVPEKTTAGEMKVKRYKVHTRLELVNGDPNSRYSRCMTLHRYNDEGETAFAMNFSRKALVPIIAAGMRIAPYDNDCMAVIRARPELAKCIRDGLRDIQLQLDQY